MELRELNTFVTAARCLSFTKTAQTLGYSQGAVTIQIKNLEEELGVLLFERLGKSISLTDHGRTFYRSACRILSESEAAKAALMEEETLVGELRIGTIDSLCTAVFPGLIRNYHEAHPGVRLSVTTDTPKALLASLRKNELDLVYLLDEPRREEWMETVSEEAEQILFVAPAAHPLADGYDHTLAELLSEPFILTEEDASYRRVLDDRLLREGKKLIPFFETNNTDLILSQVRLGAGLTFLPAYTVREDIERGTLSAISVPEVEIRIFRQVLMHKDKWRNRRMQAFLSLVENAEGDYSRTASGNMP